MLTFQWFLGWVTGREQMLSGLAALIVIVGVVVSPIGHGWRLIRARRNLPKPAHEHPAHIEPGEVHPLPAQIHAVADRPSIAVLPFDSMSDDREQGFVADGMVEDIITDLSRDRRLFVVARNSSFAYKGKAPDVRDVGRELGVHFVLEGSVRRVGDAVRVTAQFIDARTGAHAWAETINRPVADLARAQGDIVRTIVAGITSHLLHDAPSDVARAAPESLEPWELRARAMAMWNSGPEALVGGEAARLVTLALQKDPESPSLWAFAAKGAALHWLNNPADDMISARTKALAAIQHALALAPHDAYVLSSLGVVHLWTGEPALAAAILKRARAMLPNDLSVQLNLATALLHSGQPEEALAELEQVATIELHDAVRGSYDLSLADVHLALRDYDKAESLCRLAIVGSARNVWAWVTLAVALAGRGQPDKARDALREVRAHMPGFTAAFYERATRALLADRAAADARVNLLAPVWPELVAT